MIPSTIGTFNEVPATPDPPQTHRRPHCKACNWILPWVDNWEWEPDDELRRTVWFTNCWRCGALNTRTN